MATLIATLGKSPVVVTSIANLLLKKEGVKLDKVKVIYPSREAMIDLSLELIERTLKDGLGIDCKRIEVQEEDFNTTESINNFFWSFYSALKKSQNDGEEVYISIAGGRKGMSAMGLLIAQLFSNVKKVLHIVDTREGREDVFYTIEKLFEMPEEKQKRVMLPDPSMQKLIEFPFCSLTYDKNEFEHIEKALMEFYKNGGSKLNKSETDLLKKARLVMDSKLTDYGEFLVNVLLHNGGHYSIKNVYFSPEARKVTGKLLTNKSELLAVIDNISMFFKKAKLSNKTYALFKEKIDGRETEVRVSKFFKGKGERDPRNAVRIFFYEHDKDIFVLDIYFHEGSPILGKVTGKNYDKENKNSFKMFKDKIKRGEYGKRDDFIDYRDLRELHPETVLIVSLGLSPGIIIEAFEKLKKITTKIKKIYVVYPGENNKIYENLSKVKGVIEDNIIEDVPVEGLKDIDSEKAIGMFEKKVEDLIQKNPSLHKIILITGGRKTMSASMLRVASMHNIANEANIQAYHVLVNDAELERKINQAISKRDKRTLKKLISNNIEGINLFTVPMDLIYNKKSWP